MLSVLRLMISLSLPALLVAVLSAGGNVEAAPPLEEKGEVECPELGLKLVGVVMAGESSSFAVFEDEATGTQGRYGIQDSLKGATVLDITDKSVVLETDRQKCVLKIARGPGEGDSPGLAKTQQGDPSRGSRSVHTVRKEGGEVKGTGSGSPEPDFSERTVQAPEEDLESPRLESAGEPPHSPVTSELPHFEPVETAPPSVPARELPHFEPVEAAPPSVPARELPHFEPVEMAPPEPAQPTPQLPAFTPRIMQNGPE